MDKTALRSIIIILLVIIVLVVKLLLVFANLSAWNIDWEGLLFWTGFILKLKIKSISPTRLRWLLRIFFARIRRYHHILKSLNITSLFFKGVAGFLLMLMLLLIFESFDVLEDRKERDTLRLYAIVSLAKTSLLQTGLEISAWLVSDPFSEWAWIIYYLFLLMLDVKKFGKKLAVLLVANGVSRLFEKTTLFCLIFSIKLVKILLHS